VILTCVVILRPTNVAPPRFLARSGEGMAWSDLLMRVAASGALRKRIIGALEAGAISMVSSDSALIPDVDVIAIDLAEPTSVRRLRGRSHGTNAAPLRFSRHPS
jgi:hypothetical protein